MAPKKKITAPRPPTGTKTKQNASKSPFKPYKYKHQINLLKNNSDFLENLKAYHPGTKFTEHEINNHCITALEQLYETPGDEKIDRFSIPALYLSFPKEKDELELNLLMKRGAVQRHKDLALLKKHGITQECTVSLRDNNEMVDWSYISLFTKDLNSLKKDSARLAFHAATKYVRERNETVIELNKIKEQNKGKFILLQEMSYEIMIYFSNYFELMFKFLEGDGLQSDGKQYSGKLYNNWFVEDEGILENNVPRWKEFREAKLKWKLNDGWTFVRDETDFYHKRLWYFINETNSTEILQKHNTYNKRKKKKMKTINDIYQDWCNGIATTNIRFKTVLTFEKFKQSTVMDVVKNTLYTRFRKLSLKNVESVLRAYYNQHIVDAGALNEAIKFYDGSTVKDYHMPTKSHQVLTQQDFNEYQEKSFIETYEAEQPSSRSQEMEESVDCIMVWLNNAAEADAVPKSGLEKEIIAIIHALFPIEAKVEPETDSGPEELTTYVNGIPEVNLSDVAPSTIAQLNRTPSLTSQNMLAAVDEIVAAYEEIPTTGTVLNQTSSDMDTFIVLEPVSSSPIQVQDVTPSTLASNWSFSEHENTVIRVIVERPSVQSVVDDILQVTDEDEPIGLYLQKSVGKFCQKTTPFRPRILTRKTQQRFTSLMRESLGTSPMTRSQQKYLDMAEQSDRNTFNAMSPSYR